MYRVTHCLSVGPFASPKRVENLRAAGITHVLNVSDVPSVISRADGFAGVAHVPMSDSQRLPRDTVIEVLDTLHGLVTASDAHVYVHCVAGLVRSPTILWLYLIALGVPWKDARGWIQARSPKANAGSSRMVDSEHRRLARMHGLMHFFPHPRPNIIVPFPLAEDAQE